MVVCSAALRQKCQWVKTTAMEGISDHLAKRYLFHLGVPQKHKERKTRQQRQLEVQRQAKESQAPNIRYDLMRGSTKEAKERREEFESSFLQVATEQLGIPAGRSSLQAEAARKETPKKERQGWVAFTDGSGGSPLTHKQCGARRREEQIAMQIFDIEDSLQLHEGQSLPNNEENDDYIAGWGVAICEEEDRDKAMQKQGKFNNFRNLFGPVELRERSPYYCGAKRGSNNTAELTAIVAAACFFLKQEGDTRPVTIIYDSSYAAGLAAGWNTPSENKELVQEAQEAIQQLRLRRRVFWEWVRGHSKVPGNEQADRNADRGAAGQWQLGPIRSLRQQRRGPHLSEEMRRHMEFPITHDMEMPKWPAIAEAFTITADKVLGRAKSKRMGAPFTNQDAEKIDEIRKKWLKAGEDLRRVRHTEQEREARNKCQAVARHFRAVKREARAAFIHETTERLEASLRDHDWGKFYENLRAFGVHLGGFRRTGAEPHSADRIADYLEKAGDNPAEVEEATIEKGLPNIEANAEMEKVPTTFEVRENLNKMKDKAPGNDEITVGMLKAAGELGVARYRDFGPHRRDSGKRTT